MLKLCTFVTGTTGSGKSTMVRKLASMGWGTFHTGDLFREYDEPILKNENLAAPDSFDAVIEERINDILLSKHPYVNSIQMVAIEAIPRKESQLKFIDIARSHGWITLCVFVDADIDIRIHRIKSREMFSGRDSNPAINKLFTETEMLTPIIEKCEAGEFHYVDTSHTDPSSLTFALPDVSVIDIMTTAAHNILIERGKSSQIDPSRMITRTIEELNEYKESCINPDDTATQRQAELIDALWFLLLAFKGEGISSSEIYKMFIAKSDINQFREHTKTKPHPHIKDH